MVISRVARRLVDVPRQGVALAVEAPQQVADVWEEVAQLVRRAGRLLDRADLIIARLERRVDEAETLLERSDLLAAKVDGVVESTAEVTRGMAVTREHADREFRRLRQLLDTYQPLLQALAPISSEAVASVKPAHLRNLATLLDQMPDFVDRIAPALQGMASLPPEMHEVTDRMNTVSQVVEGLPGAKLLRKRGQDREESSD